MFHSHISDASFCCLLYEQVDQHLAAGLSPELESIGVAFMVNCYNDRIMMWHTMWGIRVEDA
jgi:hypothetical protein